MNDAVADAERLATWCAGLPALVNLIPYNPIPESPLRRTPDERTLAFHRRLLALGVEARHRVTKGDGVLAACGQLATAAPRRKGREYSEA